MATAAATATAASEGPLQDDALRRFVREGYLTVRPRLPRAFHEDVRRRLQGVFDQEGDWGNNILPRVPELQRVVDGPAVRGALSGILGPSFVAHPHRHCHRNPPGSPGQRLHKDTLDFSGHRQPPRHRPRWAIAFYYPQDVTEDMGPTGIAPGTQYFLERPDEREYPEITARALRDESRWVRRQAAEALGTIAAPDGATVPALARALRDETPFVRFNAALALARIGPRAAPAVPALVEALGDSDR